MRNLDSCRCWLCKLCPCKVRNKFLVNFWNRTILCVYPAFIVYKGPGTICHNSPYIKHWTLYFTLKTACRRICLYICNMHELLHNYSCVNYWPFKAWWQRDTPTGLTLKNSRFCPHCSYVFCIYLRTNSDLCHLQHKLIGFYNQDEKCLLRGTNWVFKWSSLRFVFKGLSSKPWRRMRSFLTSTMDGGNLTAPAGLLSNTKPPVTTRHEAGCASEYIQLNIYFRLILHGLWSTGTTVASLIICGTGS